MKSSNLVAVAAFAALLVSPAIAADNPATISGASIVTADAAKDLIAKGAQAIDVRTANEYAESHIKGAILVPYKEKSEKKAGFDAGQDSFDLAKLPADKGAAMIFYCNGLECWKSYKASVTAVKAGYTKVNWLRGGLPEWKAKGHPTE